LHSFLFWAYYNNENDGYNLTTFGKFLTYHQKGSKVIRNPLQTSNSSNCLIEVVHVLGVHLQEQSLYMEKQREKGALKKDEKELDTNHLAEDIAEARVEGPCLHSLFDLPKQFAVVSQNDFDLRKDGSQILRSDDLFVGRISKRFEE